MLCATRNAAPNQPLRLGYYLPSLLQRLGKLQLLCAGDADLLVDYEVRTLVMFNFAARAWSARTSAV